MSGVILALDQGTTSSRAIIFDQQGAVRSIAQREFRQIFPQPGWVEHDPGEIWASQAGVAAEALSLAGASPTDVAAIGIANQRETTLLWDRKSGEPLCNAIVWQDRRTAGQCDRLKQDGLEPVFREKTGLVLDAYFSGTKLCWLLDNIPNARARAEAGELAFGTVDTWLAWNLSGGNLHITDASNASRTLMFNIHSLDWDSELLDILNIPAPLLPRVVDSSAVYGLCSGNIFASIPIGGMAGDQQAALFGQACNRVGMAKNTYGTGCFMLMHTGDRPIPSGHNLLTTVAWKIDGKAEYALEGSIFIAGAAVQWLRDGLGIIRESSEIEALAATVSDNGGVFVVPAFSGLGAPHWDPYARGTIAGITRGTNSAHIARAVLESIAFQTDDLIASMAADSGVRLAELRVDGGASVNNLLMQFQADLLGVNVVRPRVSETTALGAAFLAGLSVGFWKDRDEIDRFWQKDRVFVPQMPGDRVALLRKGWAGALDRAKGWQLPDPSPIQGRGKSKADTVFEKSFIVRSYEVDSRGRLLATAILNYLQEAAGDHARLLGIAVRDLLPHGLTWVLSRMHLKLAGTVPSREELTVRTWPSTKDGRFTCREFELLAADGHAIGAATTSFAVLDIETRRPVEISERVPAYPVLARRAIVDSFATIPRLTEYEVELAFRVGRGDLDINHHVNNVVYAGWALETVPKNIADEHQLVDLEISYRAEAFYGEQIVARSGLMREVEGVAYLHQIVRPHDGAELARVISRWSRS